MAVCVRRRHLRDMKCAVHDLEHDLEVMGSNPSRAKLGVRSTSKLYLNQNYKS